MRIWPISTHVNKPENDDPSILQPCCLKANENTSGFRLRAFHRCESLPAWAHKVCWRQMLIKASALRRAGAVIWSFRCSVRSWSNPRRSTKSKE